MNEQQPPPPRTPRPRRRALVVAIDDGRLVVRAADERERVRLETLLREARRACAVT